MVRSGDDWFFARVTFYLNRIWDKLNDYILILANFFFKM